MDKYGSEKVQKDENSDGGDSQIQSGIKYDV